MQQHLYNMFCLSVSKECLILEKFFLLFQNRVDHPLLLTSRLLALFTWAKSQNFIKIFLQYCQSKVMRILWSQYIFIGCCSWRHKNFFDINTVLFVHFSIRTIINLSKTAFLRITCTFCSLVENWLFLTMFSSKIVNFGQYHCFQLQQ